MPKKNSSWGVNSKAVEARERKANQKRAENEAKQKAVDDAYWKDDNKKEQKKQARKENEQRKKQEALLRKEDARKLLEEEESKLSTSSKGSTQKKVTKSEIDKAKVKERKQLEEIAQLKEREKKKITDNPEMEEENPNRKMAEMLAASGAVEARSIDEAIGVLSVGTSPTAAAVDKHPEKRMKAAYAEFEERELPRLKEENSNLRLSQLKQMLRKEWQKSPDNPFNQR